VGDIKHDWTDEICGYKTTDSFCENCHRAGGYVPFPCIPDFTDSLDACFKWLVPKIQSEYEISIVTDDSFRNRGTTRITLTHVTKGSHGVDKFYPLEYLGMDNNPALALCLAIEKVIDGLSVY